MSIVDKLVSIETAKESIKSAITEKGVDLTGVSFIDYGGKISEISGGGGSGDYLEIRNNLVGSRYYSTSKSVGEYAFAGLSLTTVDLPNCTSVSPSAFAFGNMKYVNLPACFKLGDGCAFESCTKLTSVNLPVCSSIGQACFRGCTSLTSIDLPACDRLIYHEFEGCYALTSINLPACTIVSNSVFYRCSALTSIDLPACTTVGNYGFCYLSTLTSINLPNCTTVGGSAFYACSALTSIDLPNCTTVDYNGFRDCTKLTSVNLPACTTLETYAFAFCSALTSIDFPNCTKTSMEVFKACKKLQTVNLPVCSSIGDSTFLYCSALQTVNLPVCLSINFSAFYSCNLLNTIYLSQVNKVTYLNNSRVFSNCPALTSIYVPMSLVDAFKSATNWTYFSDKIVGWEGLVTREEIKYIPLKGTYLAGHQSTSIQIDANFDLSINLGETGRAYDDYVTICNGSLSTSALSGYDIKKAEIYCDTDSGITINNVYNSSYFADGVLTIEYGEYSHNSIVSISVGKDPINVNSIKIFYIK